MTARTLRNLIRPLLLAAVAFCTLAAPRAAFAGFTEFTLNEMAATGATGQFPYGNIAEDAGGNLFGTANAGGASNNGIVWEIPHGGALTVLHSFTATDGHDPNGVTLDSAGNIYGACQAGGANDPLVIGGGGTVWMINTSGTFSVLYNFEASTTDGFNPMAPVAINPLNGDLYGTTNYGGTHTVAGYGPGTIWKISHGVYSVVYNFGASATDGVNPTGSSVTFDVAGDMFGTTSAGGTAAASSGTLWEIPAGGSYQIIHNFDLASGSDGATPLGGVTIDPFGNIYGTTNSGANCVGTVWEIPLGGAFTVLHAFPTSNGDGRYLSQYVTVDTAGDVYGAAALGGFSDLGAIWKKPVNGPFTLIHSFLGSPTDGLSPLSNVIVDGSGNIFGTAEVGGASYGTVYVLTPSAPTTLTIGTPTVTPYGLQFEATVKDQNGNIMTGEPVTWTVTGNPSAINANGLFSPTQAGSFTITASDTAIPAVNGTATTSVSQAASSIAVSVVSVTPATAQFAATQVDQFGNPMATQPTFTWTRVQGSGSITVNGLFTCTAAGPVKVHATAGIMTGGSGVTFTATPTSINIAPQTNTFTAATTQQFTASERDQFNQPISPQPTFSWSKLTGSGSIAASGLFTATGAGTVTIQAANGAVTGAGGVVFTQTLSGVRVTAGAVVGKTCQFTGVAIDEYGNPMTTQPGGFTWSVASGSATINNSGLCTSTGTGAVTVHATTGGVTGSGSVTFAALVATTISVTFIQASATTEQFTAVEKDQLGNPTSPQPTFTWSKVSGSGSVSATGLFTGTGASTVKVNAVADGLTGSATVVVSQIATTIVVSPQVSTFITTVTQQFTATERDQFNNLMAPQPTFTWSVTSGAATINAAGLLTGTVAGAVTVQAANGALTGAGGVTFAQGVTSIIVTAGAINAGKVQFTSSAKDQFGNTKTAQPVVTWSVVSGLGSISTGGLFTSTGASQVTVQATFGGVSGTGKVTFGGVVTSIVVTPITATSTTEQFVASAVDQFGGVMATQPTFTWTKVSGAGSVNATGLFTATAAGAVTVSATAGGVSGSSGVTFNQAATAIVVAPQPAATSTGTAQQFTAIEKDQFGAVMAVQPNVTWTTTSGAGSIASTGLFTPTATGVVNVQAADGALTGTGGVIFFPAATAIVVSPQSATSVSTSTQQFAAVENDQFGIALAVQPSFVWTTVSGAGSISTTGLFTATAAGVAAVQAASGAVSGTGGVTFAQVLTTITVTPGPVVESTDQFAAVASDQYGNAMTPQPTFAWSVTGGGGTIDTNGLFTSTLAGTATVMAAAGGVSGTASQLFGVVTPTAIVVTASFVSTTTEQFTAVLNDQNGNPIVPQPTFTWAKSAGSGSVTATGLYTCTGASAVKVKATTGALSGVGMYTFTQIPTAILVWPLPLTTTAKSQQFTVVEKDQFTNVMAPQPTFIWSILSGPGVTDQTGLVTASTAGVVSLQATDGVIIGTGSVTFSQKLTTITVTAGAVTGTTDQFTAVARDQYGNSMSPQPTFTWSVVSGSGTVSATGLFTSTGTGTVTVRATSAAVSGTGSVTFVAPTPTTIVVTAAFVSNTTEQFTAVENDQFGHAIVPQPTFTWTKSAGSGTVTATGSFTCTGASTVRVKAADGALSGIGSYNFTQIPTAILVRPLPLATTATSEQFTVTEKDQFANVMVPQPTFTWGFVSGPGMINSTGLVTATGAGIVAIQATDGTLIGTGSVTFQQKITTIAVTTGAASGVKLQFNAVAKDQYGAVMATQPTFTWSVVSGAGTVGATGLYTATALGAVTVRALNGGISAQATGTVAAIPTTLVVTPTTGTLTTQQFAAVAKDQFGSVMPVQPVFTWAKVAGTGSVNSSGLFTATAPGLATVKATAGAATGSASVTFTQTAASIKVSPQSTASTLNKAMQFTASLKDQFGTSMPTQPTFTWSALTGAGSINATTGLYSATSSGTVTVQAAGGAMTGTGGVIFKQVGSSIVVTPDPTVHNTGLTQQFTAVEKDQYAALMVVQPTFSWVLITGAGTISSTTGLYTATGVGAVTVHALDGTIAGSGGCAFFSTPTTLAITNTSNTGTSHGTAKTTFTAKVTDQFGGTVSDGTIAWSVTSGGGSITSAGVYTPGAAGAVTIKAASTHLTQTYALTVAIP